MEKKKIETFEDLRVWQQGIELVKQIYLMTKEGDISRDFGLRDQLRRAAVSVPTNVAEGFERHSRKEYVNFRMGCQRFSRRNTQSFKSRIRSWLFRQKYLFTAIGHDKRIKSYARKSE